MKTKIALLRCPYMVKLSSPDVGLGYISSVLRARGYQVAVKDLNWDFYNHVDDATKAAWNKDFDFMNKKRLGLKLFEDLDSFVTKEIEGLLAAGYRVFGISVYSLNRDNSVRLARTIKKLDARATVLFGGPDCMPRWNGGTLSKEEAADGVVYGEGEETILDLVASLEESGGLRPCRGAYVRQGAAVIMGEDRPGGDPEGFPYPDFSDFAEHGGMEKLAILFNRGCPRQCKHCSVPGYIPQFRWRKAHLIFKEMLHQIRRYGIKGFFDYSPMSNGNMVEIVKLCDLIIEHGAGVTWGGYGGFHPMMTEPVLEKMSRAGCHYLHFGMESGSQKILDSMEKCFKIEQVETIIRTMKKVGIDVGMDIVVGFPGETEEDFKLTCDFLERNAGSIKVVSSVNRMFVKEYMRVYDDRAAFGIVDADMPENWRLADSSNTYEIREDRRQRAFQLVRSLGLT